MKDLDALKQELARDGRLQRLQAIADSTDGLLRQILTQVLSTDAGQRLAGKVKDAMQDG